MLVIVPSRGRPDNIKALYEAFRETSTGSDTYLVVAVDEDDPKLDEYLALADSPYPPAYACTQVGPRLRLGGTLNKTAAFAIEHDLLGSHNLIGFMGDDHRPRTRGWDVEIMQAHRVFGDGVVYGNDLIQGQNLPTAAFISTWIIRTLGYMVPPRLIHLYIDNAWKSIGEGMGRLTYLPDVIIEHMHPIAGKAEWDAGYNEANSADINQTDHDTYDHWVATGLPMDIIKLREAGLC